MREINENVQITWVEDDVWRVCEWYEGSMYEYLMTADEVEAAWGDVWQA